MVWWHLPVYLAAATAAGTWLLLLNAQLRGFRSQPPAAAEPASLAEGLADLAAVRAEWRKVKLELDGYFEALEDVSETVERKRRSTASRQAKMKEREEAVALPAPVDLRARARSMGIPV